MEVIRSLRASPPVTGRRPGPPVEFCSLYTHSLSVSSLSCSAAAPRNVSCADQPTSNPCCLLSEVSSPPPPPPNLHPPTRSPTQQIYTSMKSSEAFAPIETAWPGPERVVVVVCAAFFASRFAFAARNLARISWKREGGKEGGRDREKEKERGGGGRER
jgi:hypothetical protein